MQRQVKCLYKLMLKDRGRVANLKGIISFYDDYNKLTSLVKNNKDAPGAAFTYIPNIKMPKQWAKKYLVKRKKK